MKGIKYLFCTTLLLVGGLGLTATRAETANESPVKPSTDDSQMVEVLVTGEQPGPGLWKISKGNHVMYVLGTYDPLPKKMTWHSKQVEETIARSEVFLNSGSFKADIGFFKGLTLLPSLIGVRDNPNDAELKDILPADLYERWHALKEKYIGSSNSVEKWRPIFAARELYYRAIEKMGMERGRDIRGDMDKLAKKAKVKIVSPTVEVEIDKPRAAIKEFKKSPLDDVQCFAKTIERLETDLELMRIRANAWAVGDVEALKKTNHIDQATACIDTIMNAQVVQEQGLQDVPQRLATIWLAAAEKAIEQHTTSFAVLSIDEIYKSNGYVAKLRERGYQIEDPR